MWICFASWLSSTTCRSSHTRPDTVRASTLQPILDTERLELLSAFEAISADQYNDNDSGCYHRQQFYYMLSV